MAVEDGHEDRDPAGAPGRGLRRGGDRENGAVGGGKDRLLAPLGLALRVAEELQQEEGREQEGRGDDGMAGRESRRPEKDRRQEKDPTLPRERDPQCATPSR